MKQLTVRGFDKEVERRIREVAQRQGISLNRAALLLLRKGAGLGEEGRGDTVGKALDHLIGGWSEEQAQEMLKALQVFEQIDPDLWA